MVKIIEGTYKHAHAIAAGDLKHYAITIVEDGLPVIILASSDTVRKDVFNAAYEVKARGGYVIGVSPTPHETFSAWLPVKDLGNLSGLMNVVLLQLLSYYLTVLLGHPVDKPRNIAKSVTVK